MPFAQTFDVYAWRGSSRRPNWRADWTCTPSRFSPRSRPRTPSDAHGASTGHCSCREPGNFVADGARPRQPSLAFVPGWLVCWRDSSNWRNVGADLLRRGTRSVSGDDYTPRYHPAQAERAASEILPVIVLLHSY